MQTSYSWLRELISFDLDADTLADRLTMIGTAVQWLKPLLGPVDGITAVEVLACEKHPSADRLQVCRIRTKEGERTLVCGAPNARAGIKAVWIAPGGKLPDGTGIDAARVRGVESAGMLCSEAELGLSTAADTIIELPEEVAVGAPAAEIFGDKILAFELTPNRPDCLSTFGIAREIGGLAGDVFARPDFERTLEGDPTGDKVQIRIVDPAGCPRYAGALIENLKVGPSPWWLQQKVRACGMRPINNLVDVTNFVMMETGQPLHAFDYDKMKRKEIVVRASKEGEQFTTLDNKTHTLPADVVLITDGAETIGLGGIMGGLDSEVSDTTRTILLEAAYFDAPRTRRARKALGIESEAALRFEKGTDPNMVPYALERAAHLLAKLGQGTVRSDYVDVYPQPVEPRALVLRVSRTNQLLGLQLSANEVERFLTTIGFEARADGDDVTVQVPTFRPDVEREIDLIEEVARLYGLEKIPIREQGGGRLYDIPDHDAGMEEAVHQHLAHGGFSEIVTNSLGAKRDFRLFYLDAAPTAVANPLSEDLAVLRPTLLSDLAKTAAHNFNHRNLDWRLYTLGLVFLPVANEPAPHEELRLGLALAGRSLPRFWGEAERATEWFDLKGVILDLFCQLRLPTPEFISIETPGLAPDASFVVRATGQEIGRAGRLGPKAAKQSEVDESLWLAELSLPAMQELRGDEPEYHALPRFPGVMRDLALVVSEETAAGDVTATIRQTGGELLVELELFDLYRGKPLEPGTKSLAFSLVFRSPERSLQAAEVDEVLAQIVVATGDCQQATLRA